MDGEVLCYYSYRYKARDVKVCEDGVLAGGIYISRVEQMFKDGLFVCSTFIFS